MKTRLSTSVKSKQSEGLASLAGQSDKAGFDKQPWLPKREVKRRIKADAARLKEENL
jgi:hypothetical protein